MDIYNGHFLNDELWHQLIHFLFNLALWFPSITFCFFSHIPPISLSSPSHPVLSHHEVPSPTSPLLTLSCLLSISSATPVHQTVHHILQPWPPELSIHCWSASLHCKAACGSKYQFGCPHAKLEHVNNLPHSLLVDGVVHCPRVPQFQQYGQVDCTHDWEPWNSWVPVIALTNDSFNGSRQFINPPCLGFSAKIGIIMLCSPSSQDFARNIPTSKFYVLYMPEFHLFQWELCFFMWTQNSALLQSRLCCSLKI